jgi:hypothetical protein
LSPPIVERDEVDLPTLTAAAVRQGVHGRFLICAQGTPQGAPIRLMGGPGYRALTRNPR